jgi:tetratricopeptide (TPR) repeat protein
MGPAYVNRGLAYQQSGDLEKALADYDKAIELYPKFAFAYYSRGKVYEALGQVDMAVADYKKCAEVSGDSDLTQKAQDELKRLGK